MSEWLLFSTKWWILQLYYGENKLHSIRLKWCWLCTRPTRLDMYSGSSVKQEYVIRNVAQLVNIILVANQTVFVLLLNVVC